MSPEAQRIAIAEACGVRTDRPATGWHDHGCPCQQCNRIPYYPSDLNAMHDAGQTLIDQGLQDRGLDELVEVVVGANVHWSDYHCFPQVNRATAAQRAEAFLKTIGKWEESSTESR